MDKYEKVKKIGEGSFGKAILVKSREDGHQYVIKEIGISRMSNKERQESRKEVAVLANMSHPNIVQYKESFEENGCLYIVMDYCEGGDLFKKINNQKGLLFPEEQILDWFVQICLALKHVHDRKILHRDIKSQNIFLTKDGTIQLGDFGIARVLNSTVELARTCIGTPYYLSPEICENKPYNNKSDIWALGCVLYEMCTLKHAFEAGNMKNLVLNIIRGSYPPVSGHYSQDLRALLGLLFKRNPRERPSVGAILDKPFLARRIQKFLSPQLIAQEFSQSLLGKQPKISVAQGVPAKHPVPGPASITPTQKITKPAAKYGVPLTAKRPADAVRKPADAARKPVERKPGVKLKQAPLPAAVQRRMNRMEEERRKHEEGARKKRMELMERERKQREQMFLLKAAQMKRFEREKLNRINRAREQGWRNVLSSSGGSSPERKFFGGGGMGVPPTPVPIPSPVPGPAHVPPSLPGPVPGSKASGDGIPAKAALDPGMPNGHACLSDHHSVKSQARRTSLQNESVTKNEYANRLRAQVAAERAKQVEEFLQRKQEALLNKVRAEGQLGARQNLATIFASRTNSSRGRRPRVNKEEEEYLARLRQIRLQNFNERQQIKARLRGEKHDSECSDSQESCEELELRRKKIEALKAQSKARAAVLKEQLEKKRREAYEKEKKAWEEHLAARGVKVEIGPLKGAAPPQPDHAPQDAITKATPPSRPTTPAISMTAALKDVGVTAPGQNIPVKEDPSKPETSDVQSERKEILRRLNHNLKAYPSKEEDKQETAPLSEPGPAPQPCQPVTEERPQTGGDRRRWETGAPPVLSVAQYTLEDTCSTMAVSQAASSEASPVSGGDRKKWQPGDVPLAVAHQTLEDTSITTAEQTSGEVIPMGEGLRKVWGQTPVSEVLKILEEAELQPLTQCLDNSSVCDKTHTESLKPTLGPSDDPDGVALGPYPQPSQAVIDQDQEEQATVTQVQDQQAVVGLDQEQQATICQDQDQLIAAIYQDCEQESVSPKAPSDTEVISSQELKPGSLEKSLPDEKGSEETDEIECLVLEEDLPQTSKPPAEVVNAWGQKALQPGLEEGSATLTEKQNDEKTLGTEDEKQVGVTVPGDAAFVKLSCSPAHRRAVVLSTMSAQSSVEDTSSSVASRSRSVSPLRRHDDALLIGLSTGLFDSNNPKMLRTCSLPDLSKIFIGSTEPDGASTHDNNLEIEDLEDKEDEQSDTDAYEDEDLRELRASMERLLQQQRSDDDDEEDGVSDGSPPDEDEHAGLNGQSKSSPVEGDLKSAEAVEEDDDNPENNPEKEASNGHDAEEDEEQNSERKLNEEWQSDDSEEEVTSDSEQQESIFSRLEELRFHLEQAMGFEHFIQAYNKIKAIIEDEDKSIAVGSNMVQSILGPEHQHLYPKILHLVMADGAYEEDNDE
ncbi:serine/threonine-protein kinase Nek1 isoform X1 [Pangasianodon hypophthalmus]|uniref:serine/threonine-protein kinase Nek1 isoform X1 n=1 Tax=Pangasianodon hypophthalmus TaxID=310915 RepID=UPI002307BFFE|nr:serine/threonine-protein kinase Nek1 isoform X1 [Pangasianodon hypophthalmus]XP_034158014.2 serine/threonine-protein kinase Nek1 isoform X1 [Pangasianodon hypophthalmus]XP_034158015.2 serine/threonine-protein kinase Nek1 isoform X1 [Pangasianodon hypophthalmus]XP_034158016.2 serine/threonine-protein kinase Nek1 isoform X1 [Pangasianodon hypophthalmus]